MTITIFDGIDRLMTRDEMSEKLAVSNKSVERMAMNGRLPALRLGAAGMRRLRFDPNAVRMALEKQTICPQDIADDDEDTED